MTPDKISEVQRKRKKQNKEPQPLIWSNLPVYQSVKHVHFFFTCTKTESALKTQFHILTDDIIIAYDKPAISLFFNFTLLLKENQGHGPPGSGSKLGLCAEQSTVKYHAWGLIQARRKGMTPSFLRHAIKSRWKAQNLKMFWNEIQELQTGKQGSLINKCVKNTRINPAKKPVLISTMFWFSGYKTPNRIHYFINHIAWPPALRKAGFYCSWIGEKNMKNFISKTTGQWSKDGL